VRQWRKANPGYRRKKKSAGVDVQQDSCGKQGVEDVEVVGSDKSDVLQDVCLPQPALLVGIISIMTGCGQQEDIAASARSFLARGEDILRMGRGSLPLRRYENQTRSVPAATAASAPPI
jgi:hypothetical protein